MSIGWLRKLTKRLVKLKLIPRKLWIRLPIETPFEVELPDGNSFIYAPVAGDGIGRILFWQGLEGWEPETTNLFCNLASKNDLFIDIGANTGVYTLLACAVNQNSLIVSFEPVPRSFARLKRNVKINGWENRCILRNEAVSNENTRTSFHVPFTDNPVSASLHKDGFRNSEGELIEVEVMTIDSLFPNGKHEDGRSVGLVKIDVEGFEDKVFEGMSKVITSVKPDIVFECLADGSPEITEEILQCHGYDLYHAGADLQLVDTLLPSNDDHHRNFVATIRPFDSIHENPFEKLVISNG